MDLIGYFKQFVHSKNLFTTNDRILIAVSGGVDSVVLCELMKRSGFVFEMAHSNFCLRGADSDADEEFVKEIGFRYGVRVWTRRFETEKYAADNKCSIQQAARQLRYDWFNSILSDASNSLQYVATAHHANDNIETLLMNFFKGTGISGLQGIRVKDSGMIRNVVRPLLFAKKTDLLTFAQEHQLSWREDISNESNKYTRNFFRNELIPSIEKVYPQVQDNLLDNLLRFSNIAELYQYAIVQFKGKLVEVQGNEIHVPVLKLIKTPGYSTVLYEIIKDYGFSSSQISEAVKLTQSLTGKYIESATHKLFRNRSRLTISPLSSNESSFFWIDETDMEVFFSNQKMMIQKSEGIPPLVNDPQIALLDTSQIRFPLLLRKWRQGDYFYPLGMVKKKKLSRFFIDSKLSVSQKESVWVLESQKKIIWVVGYRIDNRFKITERTKSVFRFESTSSQ